jgi:hypothetical protein
VSQATYDEVIELIKRTPKCDHICLLVNYVGRIPFQEKAGEPIGWLRVDDETTTAALEQQQQQQQQPLAATKADSAQGERRGLDSDCDSSSNSNLSSSDLSAAGDDEQQQRRTVSAAESKANNERKRPQQVVRRQDDEIADAGPQFAARGYQVGVAAAATTPTTNASVAKSLTLTSLASSSSRSSSSRSSSSRFSCASSAKDDDDDDEAPARQLADCCLAGPVSSSSAASTSSGCSIGTDSLKSACSSPLTTSRRPRHHHHQETLADDTLIRVPGGRRTSEPFGCGVVKGPDAWPGIFVQNVKRDSLAERVGLEPGDQLIRAERHELSNMSFEDAIGTIKRLQQEQDEMLLVVRKGAALKHLAKCKQHHIGMDSPSSSQTSPGQAAQNESVDLSGPPPPMSSTAQVADGERRQAKCQPPPPVRKKPMEPPPAPPARSNQQVAATTNAAGANGRPEHGDGLRKLEHDETAARASAAGNGGRPALAKSISQPRAAATITETKTAGQSAPPDSSSGRSRRELGDNDHRQQQQGRRCLNGLGATALEVSAGAGAADGAHERQQQERPKTISERAVPPTDPVGQQQQRPARRVAAAGESRAANLQTLQRTESAERARLIGALGATGRPDDEDGQTGSGECARRQQRQQQQQQNHRPATITKRTTATTRPDKGRARPADYEPAQAGDESIGDCCRRRTPDESATRDDDDDDSEDEGENDDERDEDDESESFSASLNREDANDNGHRLRSAAPTTRLDEERPRTGKLTTTTMASKKRSSEQTGCTPCAGKTIREVSGQNEPKLRNEAAAARAGHQDEPTGCEQIRIVKQNCKLHHNSMQSLVRSKMFLQQQFHNDCHPIGDRPTNLTGGVSQKDLSAGKEGGGETRTALKARLAAALRSNRAPSVARLQRYVSVDNLFVNTASKARTGHRCNELLASPAPMGGAGGKLKRLAATQQMPDSAVCARRYELVSRHPAPIGGSQTRSSGADRSQTTAAACRGPISHAQPLHHTRIEADYDELHDKHRHRRRHPTPQQHYLEFSADNYPASQLTASCCLMLACLNNPSQPQLVQQHQQQHVHQAMPFCADDHLARPATMKHLRSLSTAVSSNSKLAGMSGTSNLLRQHCSGSSTLALAKFKARSEDKLNLMNINLNYVKIGVSSSKQQQQQQQQAASRHLLRLQQARHQQQARILAAGSSGQRHHDWRRLMGDEPGLGGGGAPLPSCCLGSRQQQQRPPTGCLDSAESHRVPSVFNYATATGMISQTRKVSPLARSCCAIDRLTPVQLESGLLADHGQRDTANELFDLMMLKQKQHQRKLKPLAAPVCYAYACCCPAAAAVVVPTATRTIGQKVSAGAASSHQHHHHHQHDKPAAAMAKSKQLVTVDKTCANGGASTDSSGYQSASELARRETLALAVSPNQAGHKLAGPGNCCRYADRLGPSPPLPPPRADEPSPHSDQAGPRRDTCHQAMRLSTFVPVPMGNGQRQLPAGLRKSPGAAIEIGASDGSCGVSSLSSTVDDSSPSSLSPSSCSPMSSPGRRYLSSAGSSASSASLAGGDPPPKALTSANINNQKSYAACNKRSPPGGGGQDKLRGKSIPRPPPMPLGDLTLSTRGAGRSGPEAKQSTEGGGDGTSGACQQQLALADSDASTPTTTPVQASAKLKSNKLCFVDELKMLANASSAHLSAGQRQQQHNSSNNSNVRLDSAVAQNGQLGDSSTLIKLINANKAAATSGGRRPASNGERNECACCQAADCSRPDRLDGKRAAAAVEPSCRRFGCERAGRTACAARPTKKGSYEPPASKSGQLRNEQDNKRRQHGKYWRGRTATATGGVRRTDTRHKR